MKRRARRRLVGAIALVVFLVIVLPIVLEKEPKPESQDLVIQIPSQDAGRFNTRILPPPAAEKREVSPGVMPPSVHEKPAPKPEAKSSAPKAEAATEPPGRAAKGDKAPSATEVAAAAAREADARRAQAILEGNSFVIPLGAFTQRENIQQLQARLTAGGIKSFTDTLKGPRGEQTRVRAGPFDTRDAAERAREKLKAMGIDAGPVTQR